jgi:hypothetical protein
MFDRYAEIARSGAGWQHRELTTSHLPSITNPLELTNVLMEAVG